MPGFSHTAVELFNAGLGPVMVPIRPFSKAPRGNSVTAKCASLDEAARWDADGLGVGIRGGDGYLWIDNDFGRFFTRLVEQAMSNLGVVGLRRFVDTPTHRRDAFLFRMTPPTKTLSLKFFDPLLGVEGDFGLRGSGQQALITGIHPPTGARYLVSRKITRIEDVPEIPAQDFGLAFQWIVDQALNAGLQVIAGMPSSGSLVYAVPRALGLPHQAQTRAQTGVNPSLAHDLLDPTEIRQLLGWVTNDPTKWSKALAAFLSIRDNWVKVCFAVIGATGGSSEGREIWIWWSDQQAQPKRSSSDQWDYCISSAQTSGVRVGGTFLIELAQKFAWEEYHKASAQSFADHPFDLADFPDLVRPVWDAFRALWIVWSAASRYIEFVTGSAHDAGGFNMACADQLPRLVVERYGPKPKKRPPSSIAAFMNAQPDKVCVDAIVYHPGKPRLFRDAAGRNVFNEWTPPIFARFPVSAADVKPWLDHLLYVLKAPNEVELFIRWCAFLVQYPDDKPNWAWLIMSLAGVGKDTMIEPMRVALGRDNVQPFDFTKLGGAHNYFVKCKLLIASEIAQHDNTREAKANFDHFKVFTTRPPETLTVNPKRLPPYQIPNRCGVMLFSNEPNPVAFDRSDRRLHVLSCLDVPPRDAAYYQGLHDWLTNQDGATLIANYLEHVTLSQADIHELKGPAPMTPEKQALAALNSGVVGASQFPSNVVPIRPKKPASKKGFSTNVPDDPI
jgi:Family of unknown function (DUF5906)